MNSKNIKKIVLLVTLTLLLIGLVSAAELNKSTEKKTKVDKQTKVVDNTVAKKVSDYRNTKGNTKKIKSDSKNCNISASSYEDLVKKVDNSKISTFKTVTINLNKGTYKATANMTWNDSSSMKYLIINGNGATLNGQKKYTFMNVGENHTLILKNIKFTGFKTCSSGDGAVIKNEKGNVKISNCEFSNNSANYGGAISNRGNLTLKNNTFTNNMATWDGGAIINDGTISLTKNTFKNNKAIKGSSGAIESDSGEIYVTNNIFISNTAKLDGGAICNYLGYANITNNTFTKNRAENGGAIDSFTQENSYYRTDYDEWGDPEETFRISQIAGKSDIYKNIFIENKATNGGAIGNVFIESHDFNTDFKYTTDSLEINIINNTFKKNRADKGDTIYSSDYELFSHNVTNNIIYYKNRTNIAPEEIQYLISGNTLVDETLYNSKLTIKLNNTKPYIGSTVKATITLKDNGNHALANKKVNIKIGSKTYDVNTNSNGIVSITYKTTMIGKFKVIASFAGTIENGNVTKTSIITVQPKVASKITIKLSKTKAKVNDKVKVTVTLKNKSNKVIKNQKVTVKIATKTYTIKTNSKGIATITFKVTKAALGKKILANYNGNYMYKKSQGNKLLKKA